MNLKSSFIIAAICTLVGRSAHAGLTDLSVKWERSELVTCWVDQPAQILNPQLAFRRMQKELVDEKIKLPPAQLASKIQRAVTRSFANSGLPFVGWKNCSITAKPDVMVVYSEHPYQAFSAGATGDPSKNLESRFVGTTINSVRINASYFEVPPMMAETDQLMLRMNYGAIKGSEAIVKKQTGEMSLMDVVHEFGHVAGLQHEHCRVDKTIHQKIDFESGYTKTNEYVAERIPREAYQQNTNLKDVGTYDVFSAMNYSWNYLFFYLLKMKVYCSAFADKNLNICQIDKIDRLLPKMNAAHGYLSPGDLETLRYVYLKEEPKDAWVQESAELANWLESIREEFLKL